MWLLRDVHVESWLAVCSRIVLSVLLGVVITSLGKGRVGLCASSAFVLSCVDFCPFSLPLGVRGWLRLVIVALPGHFIYKTKKKKN